VAQAYLKISVGYAMSMLCCWTFSMLSWFVNHSVCYHRSVSSSWHSSSVQCFEVYRLFLVQLEVLLIMQLLLFVWSCTVNSVQLSIVSRLFCILVTVVSSRCTTNGPWVHVSTRKEINTIVNTLSKKNKNLIVNMNWRHNRC